MITEANAAVPASNRSPANLKKWALVALQIVVSVGLLAWIFRDPSFRAQVAGLVLGADPRWLAAAIGVAGAGAALWVWRWGIFVRMVGIDLPAREIARIGAAGLFFNALMPGAIGGDAIKAGWLAARGFPVKNALFSAVMDRVSGLGALVICSLLFTFSHAGWLATHPAGVAVLQGVSFFLMVAVGTVGLSFVLAAKGLVNRLPAKLPGRAAMLEGAATYRLMLERPKSALLAGGISVLGLLAYFSAFYCAARAVGANVRPSEFFALMPAVDILTALPLSVGGFGVRESAFSTLLGALCGIDAGVAVAASFGGAFAGLLWGCLGLLLIPLVGKRE